jgi:DNA-binding LacI/PurR family transcriptional regulator
MVAVYTDSAVAQVSSPALTALELNPRRIGAEAVEMLIELIENPEAHVEKRYVPSKLIKRQSTDRGLNSAPRIRAT